MEFCNTTRRYVTILFEFYIQKLTLKNKHYYNNNSNKIF